MTQNITNFAESICAIRSVLRNFTDFYFYNWLLHLLDLLRINSWLISKELVFATKVLTHFLKLLRRIFSYFSKIKFSEFHKKDILPVVVIFVLDLIKTSVYCAPENSFSLLNIFGKSPIVDVRLGSELVSELSINYFSQL